MAVRMYSTRSLQPSASRVTDAIGFEIHGKSNNSDDQVFPFGRRPQLLCLIKGDVTPADHALLQGKIVRCLLVGPQIHSCPGIGVEAHGSDLQTIFARR